MGLFNKKEETKSSSRFSEPKLPDLPSLPELPELRSPYSENKDEQLPQLPSFPSNSFGERFSQNVIKDAVSGREEGDKDGNWGFEEEKGFGAEREFKQRVSSMTQRSLNPRVKEVFPEERFPSKSYQVPTEFQSASKIVSKNQPVFIRLDKFEISLHAFNESKHKVIEIEKMLHDIRELKEQEEKELSLWENEIQSIKEQMEKIERDLFSKV
jgi:hypothetical protein